MVDRSTVLAQQNLNAWVYDPQHDTLDFVSQADGALYTYDLAHETLSSPLTIGGSPSSIAISPDGQALVIGNANPIGQDLLVTRVNLVSGGVDQVRATMSAAGQSGVAHIAIDANSGVILDTLGSMPSGGSFLSFAASSDSPTIQADPALALFTHVQSGMLGSSFILTSPDHRFVLFEDPSSSSGGAFAMYDSAIGGVETLSWLAGLPGGAAQSGHGDVLNSGLVADVTYTSFFIFSQHLQLVKDLSSFQHGGLIVGAAFSTDGRELFAWDAADNQVLVFDTATWNQVGSLASTIGTSMTYRFAPAHDMQVVDSGTMLALDGGQGKIELIDLAARLNLVPGAATATPAPDPTAPVPPLALTDANITVSGNMDSAHLADLLSATVTQASDTEFTASGPGALKIDLTGSGFTYANDQLVGGSVSTVAFTDAQGGVTTLQFSGVVPAVPAAQFESWLLHDDATGAFSVLLAGNEDLGGSVWGDLIRGYAGNDLIHGAGGSDSLFGGDGDDVIYAGAPPYLGGGYPVPTGSTYLRGEAGDDYIVGGAGFDDINGNLGNDTLTGGDGGDWVLGGQGNDLAFGDAGNDTVLGNIGNDTIAGGAGDDAVRGGQGDDVLYGGAGNDWLSGDLGNDTLIGGAGADTFHASAGSGQDVVNDFNGAEGDRVVLDPGTHYAAYQVGADVIVDMGTGNSLTLKGVQLATLPTNWIGTGQVGGEDLVGGESVTASDNGDALSGGPGDDTLIGGAGADSISGGDGSNYLRGGDGNDQITGGSGFDDTHGNLGDDTIHGGGGNDWVLGGQSNDLLYGDDGNDLVFGNLGNDTLDGGAGDDGMQGGQGDDVLTGGAGNDYLSGDRGDDTLTGGDGADTFHSFAQTGIDKVTDFNGAEGDRIRLDPGTIYTLVDSGGDTIIDMGGGNQMILVGVQSNTLQSGWITVG